MARFFTDRGRPPLVWVDESDGIIREQRVGPPGQAEVVADVAGALGQLHAGQGVAQGDALVQGGKAPSLIRRQGGLAHQQAGKGRVTFLFDSRGRIRHTKGHSGAIFVRLCLYLRRVINGGPSLLVLLSMVQTCGAPKPGGQPRGTKGTLDGG